MAWSGQYENMLRVKERLKIILPITLVLIFGLLYLNTRSSFKAGVVMLAVPFSAVGAIWLLYVLGYNVSIAVLVYPAIYYMWRRKEVVEGPATLARASS
jgi:Cu(I)/Ag(I) efflux system membrane protein CusA/SilA